MQQYVIDMIEGFCLEHEKISWLAHVALHDLNLGSEFIESAITLCQSNDPLLLDILTEKFGGDFQQFNQETAVLEDFLNKLYLIPEQDRLDDTDAE